MMPVSSPCAPAEGWRLHASRPVTAHSICSVSYSTRSAPCEYSEGNSGCAPAKPGSAAIFSLILGLYFMVQEPSGYMPVSTPKFHVKARVVAHHIQLSQVGQIQIRPHHAFRLIGGGGHVRFGQAHAHASGAAFFPQQGLVQYETRHPGPRLIAHQAISFRMASMSARLRVSVTQKR